ncbi:MAG: VanZ family protein [Lachnospiraceae bacterium]|nr:VanZ family protein [Lachnospiraceae bacterium]
MNKKIIIKRGLPFLWLIVIWGHSLMPGEVSGGESSFITSIIIKILPFIKNGEQAETFIRKTAHFTEFAILAVLIAIAFSTIIKPGIKLALNTALSGLFAAFVDETVQLFVEGRSGEVKDMWIDFAGVCVGTLITLLILRRKRRS